MPSPEKENLRLSKDATEIHLNPSMFSRHALTRILKLQIGTESEITIRHFDGTRLFYSEETMLNAKKLSKQKRQKFINLTLKAIVNSNEITIKGKAVKERINEPSFSPYDDVFRTFIEKDPALMWLDK